MEADILKRRAVLSFSYDNLTAMLKDKLPAGTKILDMREEPFTNSVKFCICHPNLPYAEEGCIPPEIYPLCEMDDKGNLSVIDITGSILSVRRDR